MDTSPYLSRLREIENEYLQFFAEVQEGEDAIRFTDPNLPDMYSHNCTLLKEGLEGARLHARIKALYEAAREHAVEPIGCTVPSVLGWDEGIPPRQALNHAVQRFCRDQGMLCADLFGGTCDPATNRLAAAYASDGLHLNAAGYRRLAEILFHDALRAIVARELG